MSLKLKKVGQHVMELPEDSVDNKPLGAEEVVEI